MATRVATVLEDDLDGHILDKDDAEQVPLAIDGDEYLLDLSTENALALHDALAPFIKNAKPVRRARGTKRRRARAARPRPVIPTPSEVPIEQFSERTTEPAPEPDPPLDPADPRRVGSNGELLDAALRRTIRQWGKARDWPGLGVKGRLPGDLVEAYYANEPQPAAEAAVGG